jgi:subfamily B ATP-binding cassette protein MsbA
MLWPLLHGYRRYIVLFLLLVMLATLAEGLGATLLIPLLQNSGDNMLQLNGALHWIAQIAELFPENIRNSAIAGLIVSAILVKAALAYAYTCLAVWIKNESLHKFRTRMYEKLLGASQTFLDNQQSGVLQYTLGSSADQTSQSIQACLWLLLNITTILVYSALLVAIAWQLTLALLITLLVLSLLVRLATQKLGGLSQDGEQANSLLGQRLKEGVLGLRTIHIFGQEAFEKKRFSDASQQSHRYNLHKELLIALSHPLSEGLAAVVMMGLVILAQQAEYSMSVLVTMVFMLLRLQPQFQNINSNISWLASLQAAVQSVTEQLNCPVNPCQHSGARTFKKLEQGIRFEQVSFSYPGGHIAALESVDLVIPQGGVTALVGPSGSGKSTLINLLCRFYDPTSGQVLVDGVNLTTFELASWRKNIAVVSQEVHLFGDSIRENIAYGKLEASAEEIITAAKRAHAHEFIMHLPQGYDTQIGESGKRLSGGQRQRLSIARAFLRDPEILIFDEATNALDTLSEAHIKAAIEGLGHSRTVIVIAHRLSTIEHAHNIVVVDKGRIIEQGGFSELLNKNGLFARLYHTDLKATVAV